MSNKLMTNEELGGLLVDLSAAKENFQKKSTMFDEVVQRIESVSSETKAQVAKSAEDAQKALNELNKLNSKVTDFMQKADRDIASHVEKRMSAGELIVKSSAYTAVMKGDARNASMSVPRRKAITNITGASLLVPDQKSLITLPEHALTVRDLITQNTTVKDSVSFSREVTYSNNAAGVLQRAQKPTSDWTFENKVMPVVTIAHLAHVSKQMLDDVSYIQSFIDGRLQWGLKDKEELQLLYGDGTAGVNLEGLTTVATTYNATTMLSEVTNIANATRIDEILAASTIASNDSKYQSSAIVLNPLNWAAMLGIKDSTGRYMLGSPDAVARPVLWGLPVVPSFNMVKNNFLTGAFNVASEILDREEINVFISFENDKNVETNMVTFRCEERTILMNYVPSAYIYGTFTK